MIVFIDANSYDTSAASADTIDSVDCGFVRALESESRSFKLGNTGIAPAVVTLTVDDPLVSVSVDSVALDADEISNTITVTVAPPLECPTRAFTASLVASVAGGGASTLEIDYTTEGANQQRLAQYPARAGDRTDNFQDVVDRFSEPVIVHRFHPVAYDPADTAVFVVREEGARALNGDAGNVRFVSSASPCTRLDPNNERWGYTHTSETVPASFQGENYTIEERYTSTNTAVTWTGDAHLLLPPDAELTRQWALFAPRRASDRAQYKRTVFLVQRIGRQFGLQNIMPVFFGDQLAFWSCDLIPIQQASNGSPGFYNPFSITYDGDGSDRPYAVYPCFARVEIAQESNT